MEGFPKTTNDGWLWIAASAFLAALWGSSARYAQGAKSAGTKWTVSAWLVAAGSGTFIGVMAFILAQEWGYSDLFSVAVAGLASIAGNDSMQLVEKIIRRYIQEKYMLGLGDEDDKK